ncbi:MAG: hypothetical protein QOJ89_4943 [bacterium]
MPQLPVSGTQLHYERRGSGEPLLLVQGLGGHSGHWGEPFLADLERDFELVVYDHRGTGRSAPLNGTDISTVSLAHDALALLDGLGVESVHVMGISMGGMVAQELALRAPERVRTLTHGCTSAGGTQSKPTSGEIVQELTAAVLSGDFDRVLRAGFGVCVSPGFAANPANYAAFGEVARSYPTELGSLMSQQAALNGHDAYGRLQGIEKPTLVIHGTEDRLLERVNGELIAGLIPGARLELLEGVGHLFFWEQPERSAALVREHVLAGGS